MKKSNTEKFEILYKELKKNYKINRIINREQILNATEWKLSTFNTYFSKKLVDKVLIKKSKEDYMIINIEKYDKNSFLRLMSQKQSKSETPFSKELKEKTNVLLQKSRESALLAVDIYNRPQTKFKTEGYICMMIIAWTSLFHSIFEENNEDYYSYDSNGNIIIIDGENKFIDLSDCIKRTNEIDVAVKENLIFLIGLRNKIEHRITPTLDLDVCGECQACLLNYEKLLNKKYGLYYSISENLAIPLQLTNFSEKMLIKAKKEFQSKNYDDIKEYILNFRNSLDDKIYNSMDYSFKVYLIPKIANHINSSDMSIEFLKLNDIPENEQNNILNAITLIKEKQVPTLNSDYYKPSDVCQILSKKLNKSISINYHVRLWKFYNIRKSGKEQKDCNTKYCVYDKVHQDYVYTNEWINFLTEKLQDEEEIKKIEEFKY